MTEAVEKIAKELVILLFKINLIYQCMISSVFTKIIIF